MTSQGLSGAAPRRSAGGSVVERCLRDAGFETATPGVALVETSRPGRRADSTVLAQSAWNVIPRVEFLRLGRRYPARMQARMAARRAVSIVNLRRAARVVCLTEAMADMVITHTDAEVVVARPLAPLDLYDGPKGAAPDRDVVLVPGTVTWCKDPGAALPLARAVAQESGRPTRLQPAGRDDGSGCPADVRRRAGAAGLEVVQGPLDRTEMLGAVARSRLVVPSRLDSLSLCLIKAHVLAPDVAARRTPVHEEVGTCLRRPPLGSGNGCRPSRPQSASRPPSWAYQARRSRNGSCLFSTQRRHDAWGTHRRRPAL